MEGNNFRIMLVMPKTGYLWDEWATPPIGIAYVSAYLKHKGWDVTAVNMNLEDNDTESVLRHYIETYDIDALGTAELVVNSQKLQEICRLAKKIKPGIFIWVGGGLATNSPYETLQLLPEADVCMVGEGEIASYELMEALSEGKGVDDLDIPGCLVRRSNGEIEGNIDRPPIKDLDNLPFPDWDGFRLLETCKKYSRGSDRVVTSIVSSRSCPNSCTFCSKTLKKSAYRRRSLDSIFAEIDNLVTKYHVTQLNFNDELFADRSDRLYQFCDRMEKYHITYRICMHVGKNLTLPLLKRMYESGCRVIFYGLESADNAILKNMRKFTTIEEIERCLTITKQAGIVSEGAFIFGDPMESKETVSKTLSWIEQHNTLGLFEVAPIKLYPGSQLYEDAVAAGRIKDTVKFIEDEIPLINVSGLTDIEYKHMVEVELTAVQKLRNRKQNGVYVRAMGSGLQASYVCTHCGEKNLEEIDDLSQVMRIYRVHCHKCDALEYLNILPFYYEAIGEAVRKKLDEKKVAIFGCGNIWKTFYEMGDIFKGNNYVLADETPFLQQEGWNGRQVYSPARLGDLGVEMIICMIRISRLEVEEKMYGKYHLPLMEIRMCYELLGE